MAYRLVWEGDSLTAGAHGGGTVMPDHALAHLSPAPSNSWNEATSGEVVYEQMIQEGGTQIDVHYSGTETSIVVFWGGTNDIRLGQNGTFIYNAVRQWAQARKAAHAGWKIVLLTLLPCAFAGQSATYETDRQTFNSLIRTNAIAAGWADRIVDVGNDPRVGQPGQATDLTYRVSDGLHMNDTGRELVALLVNTAIRSLAGIAEPRLAGGALLA